MAIKIKKNIYENLPDTRQQEAFESLIRQRNWHLKRITSQGQCTEWQCAEENEWVLLLQGAAKLRFADDNSILELNPGDYLLIPANSRHRVEWTAHDRQTIWLCLHYTL